MLRSCRPFLIALLWLLPAAPVWGQVKDSLTLRREADSLYALLQQPQPDTLFATNTAQFFSRHLSLAADYAVPASDSLSRTAVELLTKIEAMQDSPQKARALWMISGLYRNRDAEALRILLVAYKTAESVGDERGISTIGYNLSQFYFDLQKSLAELTRLFYSGETLRKII